MDVLLTDALAELALEANIPYFDNLPYGIKNGLKYIVAGYDNATPNDSDYASTSHVDSSSWSETSYTFIRWFAKTYADQFEDSGSDSAGLEYNQSKTAVTVTSDFANTDLASTDYDSTVVTITGANRSEPLNITGNDKANVIVGTKGDDTLNGGKGNDTLTGGAGADIFVYTSGEGKDVIADYTVGEDIISIVGGVVSGGSASGNDVTLTIGRNSIVLKNTAGKTLSITDNEGEFETVFSGSSTDTGSGGDSDLTYDASKTSVTLAAGYTGTLNSSDYASTVKNIDASKVSKAVYIVGNTQANTISGSSKNDTIYGGAGKDSIYGGVGNDKLFGDAGNDTLNGGSGSDTLTGGDGADVFIYESGKDVITDYKASQNDKIRIGASSMTTSTSGQNVILKVGSGQITVNNAKSQKVSVIGSNGRTTVVGSSSTDTSSGGTASLPSGVTYTNSNKTLTVKSPFTGTLDLSKYASTVTIVDASTNDNFISVKGTARKETIKAGKTGSNLTGGKGDDKLYGGAGADIFNYATGDGKDTIYNYNAGQDMIRITSGTISKASVSGSNVVLSVGSGSITINSAKGKKINIWDSSGEIKTYTFTGTVTNPTKSFTERSGFEERWFIDNDNTSVTPIDSILQTSDNEYSVGEIDSTNPLKKSLDSLTLTQSKKK